MHNVRLSASIYRQSYWALSMTSFRCMGSPDFLFSNMRVHTLRVAELTVGVTGSEVVKDGSDSVPLAESSIRWLWIPLWASSILWGASVVL